MIASVSPGTFEELVSRWARFVASGQAAGEIESVLFANKESRLRQIGLILGLDESEVRLLALAMADDLEPGMGTLWSQLEARRGWPRLTLETAARLCGLPPGAGWSADSAVFRWRLVRTHEIEPGLPPALSIDPPVKEWLSGRHQIDPRLVECAALQPQAPALPSWPVMETADHIRRLWEGAGGVRIRVLVDGLAGSGRKTFAACVAARLGMPLLLVRTELAPQDAWIYAHRQAYLDSCSLAWTSADFAVPVHALPFPLQFAIVEASQPTAHPGVIDLRVTLNLPTAEERTQLWSLALPEWPREEIELLASRHRTTPGDLAAVAGQRPKSPAEAGRLIRECSRGRLGALAERVESPFNLNDMVVSVPVREALEDLCFEAAHRTTFWERSDARRMFPQGRGLIALFSGPSGTGKTMAAQVIAASLDLDLYRIDLSAIVSKWVGETSQNLERVLRAASSLDLVLLFDEADALFARRSSEMRDAQDKFANTDASHLLTAIENYSGIVILTTNLKGNIDHAFVRRMRFVVDFTRPDAGQRADLWRRSVTGLATAEVAETLDAALVRLADTVEATGAQIKYAVLGGLFRAQREGKPLAIGHLLHGLNRELSKEGRSLGAREIRRLTGEEA
jgi:hypothetical protein